MSAGELVALCVSLSTIGSVLCGWIGNAITNAKREERQSAQYVTRDELTRLYPTKEYVDGNNKLLRMEIRGLRSDMRMIQSHRPLPPLEDFDEEERG